jgi:hypothetical protein
MMVSFLGSARQTLQALSLIRYLVIQPVWAILKAEAVYPLLDGVLSLLAASGERNIPFE